MDYKEIKTILFQFIGTKRAIRDTNECIPYMLERYPDLTAEIITNILDELKEEGLITFQNTSGMLKYMIHLTNYGRTVLVLGEQALRENNATVQNYITTTINGHGNIAVGNDNHQSTTVSDTVSSEIEKLLNEIKRVKESEELSEIESIKLEEIENNAIDFSNKEISQSVLKRRLESFTVGMASSSAVNAITALAGNLANIL